MTAITLDEQRFEAAWRTSTYLVYNCVLSLQLASQRVHKTDPSEYLVFSVVACANLQRRMREVGQLGQHAIDYMPEDQSNVPMSRRRIAEATGLPRETVRRIVQRLIRRGLLIEAPDGYILVPAGLMRTGEYAWDPSVVMAPVVSMFQSLVDIGVIRAAPQSGS
jgi:hypothetical protein